MWSTVGGYGIFAKNFIRQIQVYLEVAENEKSEVCSEVKDVELCRIWKRK